jgi:hypothetical protein
MAIPFASPKLTLARAHHHIRDLEKQINAFVCEKPWANIMENDPATGHQSHKIRFTRWLPDMLPCIVFDAATNLRAVLDQSGFAAAIASGKSNPKRTNFPFGDDSAGLDNNVFGRKVADDCTPEIVALFRAFNPYKGGNDSLWALNKLCNAKKHCSLVPLIANPSVFFGGRLIGDGWISETTSPGHIGWDADKHEIELMRIYPPALKAEITSNMAIEVALDGVDTLTGKPIVRALDTMASEVERVLVATEAECRRLGFQIE